MKTLLPFVCLLVMTSVSAQQVQKFIPAPGETIGFYEYKPTDYNTEDQNIKHPLIIFLHGGGEKGDGSSSMLPSVLLHGIPANINAGHPMRFTWNGKTETFLVLSPQLNWKHGGWVPMIIEELIKYATANLRIDTDRIFLTGLSLGGGGTWLFPASSLDNAKKIAAIGVSCGACQAGPVDWSNYAKTNLPAWAFHATDDNSAAPVTCTYTSVNNINSFSPAVPPIVTIWPTGGHGIWGKVYSTDHSVQNPNLYEWFLAQNKSLPANRRPIANAGPNLTIAASSGRVNLSGAHSRDLDGRLVRFLWRQTAGPRTGNIQRRESEDGITAVDGLTSTGTYTFELKAIDDRADWSIATMNVTVVSGTPGNIPPISEAGSDQSVDIPEANLNGSASYDPDGSIATYQWRKVTGPALYTITGANTARPALSNLLIGVYEFELETTDNSGARSTDRVFVNASSMVLPVKLVYFKGTRTKQATQLVWATQNEEGIEQYEVESSDDGQHFQTIKKISAPNNGNSQNQYSYSDPQGSTYYRLKTTGRKNRITYSSIIRIESSSDNLSLEYFPNPVQHNLSVLITDQEKGLVQIRLLSLDGKKIKQQQGMKQQEVYTSSLDMRLLNSGVYLMEVIIGNKRREIRKVVKE